MEVQGNHDFDTDPALAGLLTLVAEQTLRFYEKIADTYPGFDITVKKEESRTTLYLIVTIEDPPPRITFFAKESR